MMGANKKGISKKVLFECLRDSLFLAYGVNSKISTEMINKEVDDIIKTFTKNNSDYIPLEDFVNIVTSD